jgi:TPR repeat protein
MELAYEEICHKYERLESDIVPVIIKNIYYELYDLNNITTNGDIYHWIGNYYRDIDKNYVEMIKYYLMAIKNGYHGAMTNLQEYYDDTSDPIANLYIDLVNIDDKNDIIDDKINELLNEHEYLRDIYITDF